jgi:hypothetical protein
MIPQALLLSLLQINLRLPSSNMHQTQALRLVKYALTLLPLMTPMAILFLMIGTLVMGVQAKESIPVTPILIEENFLLR